jgi:hypothetical protein
MFQKQYENNDRNKKKGGHEATRISNLFSKYIKLLKAPQGTVVNACIDVIEEVYGITMRKDQCVYQVSSKTLTVHLSGPLKSEIALNKKVILEEVGKRIGVENTPKNIL